MPIVMRTCLQQKRDNMETKGDRETKFETSKNFTDLLVWKKAHMFVLEVYQITQNIPIQNVLPFAPSLNVRQFQSQLTLRKDIKNLAKLINYDS